MFMCMLEPPIDICGESGPTLCVWGGGGVGGLSFANRL